MGIHLCACDDMLVRLKMPAGPAGKVEDWRGNHCVGFDSKDEALKYWYDEGHKKEPPTHGC